MCGEYSMWGDMRHFHQNFTYYGLIDQLALSEIFYFFFTSKLFIYDLSWAFSEQIFLVFKLKPNFSSKWICLQSQWGMFEACAQAVSNLCTRGLVNI
jgi:hypothetical protein